MEFQHLVLERIMENNFELLESSRQDNEESIRRPHPTLTIHLGSGHYLRVGGVGANPKIARTQNLHPPRQPHATFLPPPPRKPPPPHGVPMMYIHFKV